MPESLSVERVLGDRPFAEIGVPSVAAVSEVRGLVVAAGGVGPPGWQPGTLGSGPTNRRIGVYRLDDLRCRWLLPSRWPVRTVAFHPELPLAAIGTGSYDGGYLYRGELLLLDLLSGEVASVLAESREVRTVHWMNGRRLNLILAAHDDDSGENDTWCFAASVVRDGWAAQTGVIGRAELAEEKVPSVRGGDPESAARTLERLSAMRGDVRWTPRRQVRAVEPLSDGRILAALDGVQLESWLPSGQREWSVPVDGGGRRIAVAPDQRSAWVEVQWAPDWGGSRWRYRPNGVERLSLENGEVLRPAGSEAPHALMGRRDGWVALRDTRHETTGAATVLVSPDLQESAPLDLGGDEFGNIAFIVRQSPELLLLRPAPAGLQVVELEPSGAIRPLFPLDWDARRGDRLFPGPGVRLPGALVHAGAVSRYQQVDTFVARRRFPEGDPEWVFESDAAVTAMDGTGDTVFVAFDSDEVVALDAADGTVRWRESLTVHGRPTSGSSLAVSQDGRLLIGTGDGRVLVAAL